MESEQVSTEVVGGTEHLNRSCHCIGVDEERLREGLVTDLGDDQLLEERPHLLSLAPVFVSRSDVHRMVEVVRAVRQVARNSEYRTAVLGQAPEIAAHEVDSRGVFFGYDFHLTSAGPRLIEINTNAGGGLLSLYLARSQRACCPEVEDLVIGRMDLEHLEERVVEMFLREWRLERGSDPLRSLAIVEEDPASQFLYPELRLFERLFRRHGLRAFIADPGELTESGGGLARGGEPVDLIYNRLTDFYLEDPSHRTLADRWRAGRVVLTPSPHVHALYANKWNLTLLSDGDRLVSWGVDPEVAQVLTTGVPRTLLVSPERADELWRHRRRWFFKPLAGYGSRGAYRGDKLTRRVWESILAGGYVAQERIPPSERAVLVDGQSRSLKVDVRCYVYDDEVQLLGARLYSGQTTNMRTSGGGLATVFTPSVS